MIKSLRGTKDILSKEIILWRFLEDTARDLFNIYGYKEIRTPIIEEAALFIKSVGPTTDIGQKEMFVFKDRGGRDIALRPEATAGVVRAYIENILGVSLGLSKFFYIGAMFRGERPQAGRQRQFHQLGVEAIGSDSPFLDAEVIALSEEYLKSAGIKDYRIKINSLGCKKDKPNITDFYKKELKGRIEELCPDCKKRIERSVLRIFDCKNNRCRAVVNSLTPIIEVICLDCQQHYKAVKDSLSEIGCNFIEDSFLARGLDYYTRTVFEITSDSLGAKDAIGAGGRYDNLVKDLGGKKDTPAIGFAFGIERLLIATDEALREKKTTSIKSDVFIATATRSSYNEAFRFLKWLREERFVSEIDYDGRSLKSQMRRAEKLGARFVVIFGEEELKKGRVVLRDMQKGEQEEVELSKAIEKIKGFL